uniref:Peptide transport system ATP-binding protein SapD n=1 Tax=Lygus hesperus TaxID=30085 RepID=A0A0A9XI10_LYGHE
MKYFTASKETPESHKRAKRQDKTTLETALMALKDFLLESTDILNITRRARKFCENGNGMVCLLYKAIQGEPLGMSAEERKDDSSLLHEMANGVEGPPTPCPAKVEYATPVFARNYQGIWRYVVQIPYEGYFTQTVEVTTCLGPRCHYLEGKCLSSPRWVSLLVAEIYYPGGLRENARRQEADPYVFENVTLKTDEERCDGVDTNGCYQVRLYYDWFLVPGSCKCWKPDYLHKFTN